MDSAFFDKAPLVGGVLQLDITTAGASFAIPPEFQGQKCRWTVYANSGSIQAYIGFGISSTVVTGAVSNSVNSTSITLSTSIGDRVDSGQTVLWVMPVIKSGTVTHFYVDTTTGDGKLVIAKSDNG